MNWWNTWWPAGISMGSLCLIPARLSLLGLSFTSNVADMAKHLRNVIIITDTKHTSSNRLIHTPQAPHGTFFSRKKFGYEGNCRGHSHFSNCFNMFRYLSK